MTNPNCLHCCLVQALTRFDRMRRDGALPLEEVSAKVRTGGPIDDEEDYALPVWAGVLPLETIVKDPIPDAQRKNDPPVPEYLKNYSR